MDLTQSRKERKDFSFRKAVSDAFRACFVGSEVEQKPQFSGEDEVLLITFLFIFAVLASLRESNSFHLGAVLARFEFVVTRPPFP